MHGVALRECVVQAPPATPTSVARPEHERERPALNATTSRPLLSSARRTDRSGFWCPEPGVEAMRAFMVLSLPKASAVEHLWPLVHRCATAAGL